jgi:putative nucleotide binding protein
MENEEKHEERREEYAFVLDFLLTGKSFSNRAEPVAQIIGDSWFTLLEAEPKPNATMKPGERVYIGRAERDKIAMIKTRVEFSDLTQNAKNELPLIVTQIIKTNEARFVELFNNAGPLNIRQHSLELLPGVGKKHLIAILKAREEKKFESFADIAARVALLQDPAKLIADRVIMELQGDQRFYMFVKPYVKKEQRY